MLTMLESLNYSFRNPKNIIWVIYHIKQLRNYKKKKKHGVLRGHQLDKQRWRAGLNVLVTRNWNLSCMKYFILGYRKFYRISHLTHRRIQWMTTFSYLLTSRNELVDDNVAMFSLVNLCKRVLLFHIVKYKRLQKPVASKPFPHWLMLL